MAKYILMIVLSVFISVQAHATSFSFTSTVVEVKVDDGTGRYTGMSVGEAFSGTFNFGNRGSDAGFSGVAGNTAQYGFFGSSFGSTITSGGIPTDSVIVVMAPTNDGEISADNANFLNDLFATSIAAQTPADILGIFGHTFGTYYDDNDVFKDGLEFGIILFLDPATYTDVSLKTSPPDLATAIGGFFFISEADSFGNEIFRVHGSIDTLAFAAVPNCIVELSQAAYVEGEAVTADVFRLESPSAATLAMEVKVWWGTPGVAPASIINLGADGALVVPPGWEANLAPFPIHTVEAATPRGAFEFGCRLLEPSTGKLLSEDVRSYTVE
jgi:hypothetical protein